MIEALQFGALVLDSVEYFIFHRFNLSANSIFLT